jgi:hypothetical protein
MTENKRSQYLTSAVWKWHNHRCWLPRSYRLQLIGSVPAPSVIDQINYLSKKELNNRIITVRYDLSTLLYSKTYYISIDYTIFSNGNSEQLTYIIVTNENVFPFLLFSFIFLYPIIKISLCFMHVFAYCLSQQHREQRLVCLLLMRDMSMYTVLTFHKQLLSQLKYLTHSFSSLCLLALNRFHSYSCEVTEVIIQISIENNIIIYLLLFSTSR